jgi:hypothetical protein
MNPQTASVTQTGNFDLASVDQSGLSHIATVAQADSYDTAYVTQASTAVDCTASATQGGSGNFASINQH